MPTNAPIRQFIDHYFRHFNARVLRDAAHAYVRHLDAGGRMLVSLGGAMSTGEIGVSLAEMIRQGKVHAISCTGANLEEDVFNLVAHDLYERIPNYRSLNANDDEVLFRRHLNRVTDTCLPNDAIWELLEQPIMDAWLSADRSSERLFPFEFVGRIVSNTELATRFQIDPRDSWVLAAIEANVPVFVPGWEDSSLGNMYAAACIRREITNVHTMRSGVESMIALADWYSKVAHQASLGFFQIGGGISGDFAICVVPMLHEDLNLTQLAKWGYFCQVGDSVTSYGSYSGAPPNEKISWGKLDTTAPSFMIESDATIVAPLIFAYVLGL